MCVCGIVAGQKQPLGAVWCKTRVFNSGGQFDQLCNLIGGAILARSTMLAHSRAIIAYGDGRPRSKVCVCVCVCVYLSLFAFVCILTVKFLKNDAKWLPQNLFCMNVSL